MSFEALYNELEGIVKKLEGQKVSLEESLELFGKGIELSKKCLEFLSDSKGKIELLTDELTKLTEAFKIE
jgi:Exonuclease VII small subunit.